jgi:hypothetical protein
MRTAVTVMKELKNQRTLSGTAEVKPRERSTKRIRMAKRFLPVYKYWFPLLLRLMCFFLILFFWFPSVPHVFNVSGWCDYGIVHWCN